MFPDLDRIANGGLSTPADLIGEKDWEPNIRNSEQKAFSIAFSSCARSANTTIRTGSRMWSSLKSQWINVDARVDGDPKYLKLIEGFAKCVKRDGYQGTTVDRFLMGVDNLMMSATTTDRKRIVLRAGRVYAECYRTANEYRQKIRLDARNKFVDAHALDIQKAQRQIETMVARLSKVSGAKYEAVQGSSK